MNRQSSRAKRVSTPRATSIEKPSLGTTNKKPVFTEPTEYSEKLILDNIKLAQKHAHLMSMRTKMPFEDLYQVALIGLIKGCRKYDPTKINPKNGEPYKLSTIAVPFIDGAMRQYLRDRGHSSGVKFPDRWRDKASKVRKLHSEGTRIEDIACDTDLRVDEISEILEAQSTSVMLDPDIKLYAVDKDEEMEEFYELDQALMIADSAHESISEADQNLLEAAWNHPRRRQIAIGPFYQFMQKARKISSGISIATEKQIDLSIELEEVPTEVGIQNKGAKKRISEPKQLIELALHQLDLF
jgi:DNA-directed RNA polymerase specialized sigma subunit